MLTQSTERFTSSLALRWDSHATGFELVDASRLAVPLSDLGLMHGAVLVERVRTFGKKIQDLQPHKNRLERGLDVLGLDGRAFLKQLDHALEELISKSRSLLNQESDASLCIVATPGDFYSGKQLHGFAHWLPIPWKKLGNWYQSGTTLVRVQYASGAGECWPGDIKTRSRLNYFLADQDAAKRFQGGLALLCTSRGMVADTSVANLLMVDAQGNIASPRREDIVAGTSLEKAERLLKAQGRSIQFRDILFEELYDAKEVLLVGNTGCLWHASYFQRRQIGDAQAGPVCLGLQKQWCEQMGFDWKSQAILKSTESTD